MHEKRAFELYSNYLMSSFGKTTATQLSSLLDGAYSHDQVTRLLSRNHFGSRTLWLYVKPAVRQVVQRLPTLDMFEIFVSHVCLGIEGYTTYQMQQDAVVEQDDGVLIADDTIQEKLYSDENDLIAWHFDHTFGRSVRSINLLNFVYHVGDVSLPVAYKLIEKPVQYTDLVTK